MASSTAYTVFCSFLGAFCLGMLWRLIRVMRSVSWLILIVMACWYLLVYSLYGYHLWYLDYLLFLAIKHNAAIVFNEHICNSRGLYTEGWKCSVKASRRSLTLKLTEGSNWRGRKWLREGFLTTEGI